VDHRGYVPGTRSCCPSCFLFLVSDSFRYLHRKMFIRCSGTIRPRSVFVALSEVALAENGVNGAASSPTIGTVNAAVTDTSGAASQIQLDLSRGLVSCVVVALSMLHLCGPSAPVSFFW
jgi:hypothetical protein